MNFAASLLLLVGVSQAHPHLYNPYYSLFRYSVPYYQSLTGSSYASQVPTYSPTFSSTDDLFRDPAITAYLSTPDVLPTLNVLAEVPYAISGAFTVVPMLVVSEDNMRTVPGDAQIMSVSKKKPVMTVKTPDNQVTRCTPAVRIVLRKPMSVYSLKTSIVFPSEIEIIHAGFRIPITVGAVIAPVVETTYVSADTPVLVSVVYAVPTGPVLVDYVNGNDIVDVPNTQAVVVESLPILPPKNVTVIDFPDKEAEPVLQVDENDDELVNRNPPILLAPAGIVQSTQPHSVVQPFTNSKESPVLIALREEAQKRV